MATAVETMIAGETTNGSGAIGRPSEPRRNVVDDDENANPTESVPLVNSEEAAMLLEEPIGMESSERR